MNTTWFNRSRQLFSERRRRVEGKRLVYSHRIADDAFWESQWQAILSPEYYRPYLRGKLGEFEIPFIRHLPKEGKILEAGCGTGQLVVALRARGYACEGVDYAEKTIAAVRQILPDLPIRFGDATHLADIADGEYAAAISLGVVEHRREGPEPFLDEAWRILRPGGRLLISVPWFNGLRQWRYRLGAYREDVENMAFYQYAYTAEEFGRYLARAGFRTIAAYPYDHRTGMGEDIPAMRYVERIPLLAKVIYRGSSHLPRQVRMFLSHMNLFITEKIERD